MTDLVRIINLLEHVIQRIAEAPRNSMASAGPAAGSMREILPSEPAQRGERLRPARSVRQAPFNMRCIAQMAEVPLS